MMEADADILLIDEVQAVGDAAFKQKCADAFGEKKAAGKTIILVTHEMSAVERYCHRAMLIDSGKIEHLGDPGDVGRHYLQLNFERGVEEGSVAPTSGPAEDVRMLDAWVEDANGSRVANVESGEPIRLRVALEALREAPGVGVGFILANADGVGIFQFGTGVDEDGETAPMRPGSKFMVRADVENFLTQGRYFVHCGVNRAENQSVALYVHNAIDFVVYAGLDTPNGVVDLPHEIEAIIDRSEER
jgi:energy-coupling factor transporter ATP-binding protein EcfA2